MNDKKLVWTLAESADEATRVRFWDKVSFGPDCWEWNGSRTRFGHGRFSYGGRKGAVLYAHRVSYELSFGSIPYGMHVCHHCDNPSCVNPLHLFVGTHEDNMRDMMRKGRSPSGEKHGHAKLTQEQVAQIRESTGTHRDIASRFGISRQAVGLIRAGKRWLNV